MSSFFLATNTPEFFNDLCEEIRLFLSADKIDLLPPDETQTKTGVYVRHAVEKQADGTYISHAQIYDDGRLKASHDYPFSVLTGTPIEMKREKKSAVKINLYRLMCRYTGKKRPWGPLTGIRPTKYLRDLENRIGSKSARAYFIESLGVSRKKFDLAKRIVKRQASVIESIGKAALDIYIGIPFCPSICSYCSFGSKRLKKGDPIQMRYIETLIQEIEAIKPVILHRNIRSVYIGGGTPTSLDLPVLERLLSVVKEWGETCEFTVEAGRPDTIDAEVLAGLKRYGVNRISINPQTFKEKTLIDVGRKHSIAQVYDAFSLARKTGFHHINIDLILGLPGETLDDMRRSVKKAIALAPESITVHTLAIKNASAMQRDISYSANERKIETAVSSARRMCERKGYLPYYMYRQKYMKGNLENVGYAKIGSHSIYNIDMMEEVTDILAFGAGAVSKKIYPSEGRHERIANPKDLETYLAKIEKIIEKKKKHLLGVFYVLIIMACCHPAAYTLQ